MAAMRGPHRVVAPPISAINTVWNPMKGLNTVCGSMYVQRTLIAAPTVPATKAVKAKPTIFTQRVFTPKVWARCSSAPMPASARPKRVRRKPIDRATVAMASTSTVR